jgi:hypothetical protein
VKTIRVTLVLVLAISLMAAAGCKKEPAKVRATPTKEIAPTVPAAPAAPEAPAAPKAPAAPAAPAAPEAPAAPAASAAPIMGFDASKSLDEVKTAASKMDIKQLTAAATACKELYTTKQLDLAKITEQLKNIPITEKLGAESQKLAGEAKTLQESLGNIGAQLGVYLDKLKGMNADTSALQVK